MVVQACFPFEPVDGRHDGWGENRFNFLSLLGARVDAELSLIGLHTNQNVSLPDPFPSNKVTANLESLLNHIRKFVLYCIYISI